MLYLPPGCAHEGTSIGCCTTYSIGFRAPSAQELGTAFLDHLRDQLRLEGMYADPDLKPQRHPAVIPPAMMRKVQHMLGGLKPGRADLRSFLGTYLSEPKSHIVFTPPRTPSGADRFRRALQEHGARLDPRSLMLFDASRIYINGEASVVPPVERRLLRALANRRALAPAATLPDTLCSLLYRWYRDGWLLIGTQHGRYRNAP